MIRRVGVVGAGSMGAAIAALAASAGLDVVLLDVKSTASDDPDAAARGGLERALRQRAFLDPAAVHRVRVGNVEDDLAALKDCDWVVEAIIEDRDAKRTLFRSLAQVLTPRTLVTSNTSTFTLRELVPPEGVPFQSSFFATHFFNPPRALLLTEITHLPGADTSRFQMLGRFLQVRLGRRVLAVKDSPGFVANRFGIYALVQAIRLTREVGLSLEEVDALTGPLLGRPRSATFRTVDLTGLDILVLGTRSLGQSTGDGYDLPEWVLQLYREGRLGDKANGGFFRREGDATWTYDPERGDYRPYRQAQIPGLDALERQPFPERLRRALELPDPYGTYVRRLLGATYRYVLARTADVAHDLVAVDRALEWGFGWTMGPYRQMDHLGWTTVEQLVAEAGGAASPLWTAARQQGGFYVGPSVVGVDGQGLVPAERLGSSLRDRQIRRKERLDQGGVEDLGDGIVAAGVPSLDALPAALETAVARHGALAVVLWPRFQPLGYPYPDILQLAHEGAWDRLDQLLRGLQEQILSVRTAGVPVVVVLDGDARGAATTLALWSDGVVAYVRSSMGFPGAAQGLLPLGAVTGLWRQVAGTASRLLAPGAESAEEGAILQGAAARTVRGLLEAEGWDTAADAWRAGILSPGDAVSLDRDGLVDVATARARTLMSGTPSQVPTADMAARASGPAEAPAQAPVAGGPTHPESPVARVLAGVMGALGPSEMTAPGDRGVEREREEWLRLLGVPEIRQQAAAALQAVSRRKR